MDEAHARRHGMTPSELLDSAPVHTASDVAIILRFLRRNGEPNRRAVHELIRSGAIRVIDPSQPVQRWTVSTAELRRYIAEGPRRPELEAVGVDGAKAFSRIVLERWAAEAVTPVRRTEEP